MLGSRGRRHDAATVADQEGESGPGSRPSWEVRIFPQLAVFVDNGRVRGIATPDSAAQTREGVGVGDSLEIAKRHYQGLDCYGVTLGSDSTRPSYPACAGRLKGGNEVYFGGDPVDTIWVTAKGGLEAGNGPILSVR